MRAFCGWISGLLQYVAIYTLPFSLAITLYFTQPVSASIVTFLFNREKLNLIQVISIFSALIGVILIS